MASGRGMSDKPNPSRSVKALGQQRIPRHQLMESVVEATESQYEDFDRPMNRRAEEPSDARILAQLEYMGDQLSKTQALVRELEERLDPVLIPDFGQGSDIAGPDRKAASIVSNIIDDHNGQISYLQHRIIQLMHRVQL